MDGYGVYQEFAKCILGLSGYSSFMNRKRVKDVVLKTLFAIVLTMLFISLLAQRLFHPR
jgi:hypothetical protein